MAHDQKLTPFSGTERVRPRFGGMVLEMIPSGPGYEGYAAMTWDPRKKCYRGFQMSSWGFHNTTEAYWATDDQLAFTTKDVMNGQPMLMRTVLQVDDSGRATEAWAHTIVGAAPPFKSYEVTYEHKPAAGN